MKDKFKEYMKDIQGMDRIEIILDLYKEYKITKDQALVLIVNDKQIKEPDTANKYSWSGSINTGTPTTPYVYTTPTTNPYTTILSGTGVTTT